jgi:hypothetical protein
MSGYDPWADETPVPPEAKLPSSQPNPNLNVSWDWQNQPVDQASGKPIGPDGSVLPEGAVAWDQYGEPFYSSNPVVNFWQKFKYRVTQVPETVYNETGVPTAAVASGRGVQVAPTAVQSEITTQAPSLQTQVSRVPGQIVKGALEGYQQAGKAAEGLMGGANLGLQEAGAGSPLPKVENVVQGSDQLQQGIKNATGIDITQVPESASTIGAHGIMAGAPSGTPPGNAWLDGQLNKAENAVKILSIPAQIGYNAIRTLTSPAPLDEKLAAFQENFKAGKVAYSAAIDPTVRQAYLDEIAQHPDQAELIYQNLANPGAEAFGQTVFDPLQLWGLMGDTLKGARLAKPGEYFYKAADGFMEAMANDARSVAKVGEGVDAAQRAMTAQTAAREAELALQGADYNLLAKGRKGLVFNLTAKSKQIVSAEKLTDYFGLLTRNLVKDAPEKMPEIAEALMKMTSKDPNEVKAGIITLSHMGGGKPIPELFSKAATDAGLYMRELAGESPAKFFNSLAKNAMKDGAEPFITKIVNGVEKKVVNWGQLDDVKAAEYLSAQVKRVNETMFPTIEKRLSLAEKLKAGEALTPLETRIAAGAKDVSPLSVAAWKFNEQAMKVYGPANKIFSSIYMGYSPGYAFRNAIQNAVHAFVDEGVEAGARSVLAIFHPSGAQAEADEKIMQYIGQMPARANAGLSGTMTAAVTGAENFGKSTGIPWRDILIQPAAKFSNKMEQVASSLIVETELRKALRVMIKPGRAIPDVAPLVAAGMEEGSAKLLQNLLVENWGDVGKTEAAFRNAVKTGSVEVWKHPNLFLAPEDLKALQDYKWYDKIQEIANTATTPEEAKTLVAQALDEVKTTIKKQWVKETASSSATDTFINQVSTSLRLDTGTSGLPKQESLILDSKFKSAEYLMRQADVAADDVMKSANVIAAQKDPNLIPEIQKLNDDYHAQATALRDTLGKQIEFRAEVRALTKELGGDMTAEQMATAFKKYGLVTKRIPLPTKIDPGTFKDYVWQSYFADIGKNTKFISETQIANTQKYFDALNKLVGKDVVNTSAEVKNYEWLADVSDQWQKAKLNDAGIIETTGGKVLKEAVKPVRSGPWGVADKLGIAGDFKSDTHLLKSINKGLPEGVTKYTRLDEVPEETARQSLQKAIAEGRHTPTGEAESVVPTVAKVPEIPPDVKDAWDIHKSNLAKSKRLREAFNNASSDERSAKQLGGQLQDAEKASRGSGMQLSAVAKKNNLTIEDIRNVYEPKPVIPVRSPEPPPSFGDEAKPPQHVMYAANQQGQIDALFNRVGQALSDAHGTTQPVALPRQVESALKDYLKETTGRVMDARAHAMSVASEARDFALHNYGKKTYGDLALAYIYPYQFWYNRTYQNWFARLAYNPDVIAGYARYKDFLGKEHASMPDWYKYSVNTDELLGIHTDHPLFFNLEATLNPLQGLTGVDFNDAYKRVDWLTTFVDDINKFGPNTWTPINWLLAGYLQMQGKEDAASRWAGRVIPQTATIKTLTGLAGVGPPGGLDLDPIVGLLEHGLDPYETNRVNRALGTLMQQGAPEAQITDAANTHSGPLWDQARTLATKDRAFGQLMSFFGGVGLKARTTTDMSIDQFYSDYNQMWAQEANLSPNEFRSAMEQMREKYPFMDALLLGRKGGAQRDRTYAYNVMSRIPPGDALLTKVGIDQRLISMFYQTKGNSPSDPSVQSLMQYYDSAGKLHNWEKTDFDRFMAGIKDLGAMLEVPTTATRQEWIEARNAYADMTTQAKSMFGADILDRVDAYYGAKGDTPASREAANNILDSDPGISAYLDWKAQQVQTVPILSAYYGGIDSLRSYWAGRMYDDLGKRFGQDIWDKWNVYTMLQKAADAGASQYYKAHPELKAYTAAKKEWQKATEADIIQFGGKLPEGQPAVVRPDANPSSIGAQDTAAALAPQPTHYTWYEWQQVLSQPLQAVIVASLAQNQPLPPEADAQLDAVAHSMGMTQDEIMQEITYSLQQP